MTRQDPAIPGDPTKWRRDASLFTLATAIWMMIAMGCSQVPPPIAGEMTADDLISALDDERPAVRCVAIRKLGKIGDKDRDALPAVFGSLSDEDSTVRKEAIYVVLRNWPASRDALPLLEAMKERDDDSEIRKIATEVHQKLVAKK